MAVAVYLPLLLAIALAVVAPRVARALPPPAAVWSLTVVSLAAVGIWIVSLGLIASTAVERTCFVARHEHYSARYWRNVDPIAVQSAIAAAVVLGLCLALLGFGLWREARAVREVRRLSRGFSGTSRMVFVDDEAPHAYAIGGRRSRIVVSRGLLQTLGAGERRAVFAHEEAHLRLHHHWHLRVLRLAAAVFPLLRPVVPAGVLAVERWADEHAAGLVGDRTLVARTLLRAALAGVGAPTPAGVLAHSTRGDVGHRVAALIDAPPRPRWAVVVVSTMIVIAAVLSPVYAADRLNNLLSAGTAAVAAQQR